MDDRAALMAAIMANPDEDTPRLALADWLQEYGTKHDQARAEFIRLQIRMANIKLGKAWSKLYNATEKLESKHRKAWVKPLTAIDPSLEPDSYIDFRRGLLVLLFIDTGLFLLKAHQSALPGALAAVGVEELCFQSATKRVAELANSPALRFAARIEYPGADDKALAAFATAPNCAHLSKLDFGQVTFTDRGLKAFADTTNMTNLRTLTISTEGGFTNRKPKFTAAGVLALLNSPRLPQLEFLELDTGTAKFDAKPLFAGAGVQKLKTLWLSMRVRVADVVASKHLANLTTLILHDAELTAADADALIAGPTFAKLKELTLSLREPPPPAAEKALKKRFGKGLALEY